MHIKIIKIVNCLFFNHNKKNAEVKTACYKAMRVKRVLHWHQTKHVDLFNRVKS